jgi:hypothetical protein
MSYNPCVQAQQTLRAVGTALSTSFDAAGVNPEIRIQNMNRVALYVDLSLATATSVEIIVEVASPSEAGRTNNLEPAPVTADWYPLTAANMSGLTVAAGVATVPHGAAYLQLALTGKYAIVLKDVFGKYVRVRAKTTAGPGATTLAITGVEGLA